MSASSPHFADTYSHNDFCELLFITTCSQLSRSHIVWVTVVYGLAIVQVLIDIVYKTASTFYSQPTHYFC